MKVKICGLNPTRDIQLCIDLKVDFLGFVFYEKSPRNIDPKDIKILSSYDKKFSSFVAVTVNPSDEFIKKIMVSNSSILIFDDINDTGDTLSNIKNKFRDYNIDLRFAVLINNKSSSFKVDYYGSEIDKKIDNSWIVFPWENIDGE